MRATLDCGRRRVWHSSRRGTDAPTLLSGMSRPSEELARTLIERAWRDARYPGDDQICTPTYDDEGVGAYFRGRSWQGHAVSALRYHSVGLSFFTPEAFCYYLPAYLLAVI